MTAWGEHDDRPLVHAEFKNRAPAHAYRILSGASCSREIDGHWIIRSGGNCYFLTDLQFRIVKELASAVEVEYLKNEGRNIPFDVESQIGLFHKLQKRCNVEMEIPRDRLRVMFVRMDQGGCGFYRVIQPVRWLQFQRQRDEGIMHVEETAFVSYQMLANCDVIVIPRQCSYQTLAVMQALKRAGKILIYETDDLLTAIPDWNPVQQVYQNDDLTQRRELIMSICDCFIVSTPELRKSIGAPEKTYVVHNAIDQRLWPMKILKHDNKRINILWAGSDTHSKDLSIVVKTLKRLLKEFQGKIMLTFIGYAPEEFTVLERRGTQQGYFIRQEFARDVTLASGCAVQNWPYLLASAKPDICLAPLVDIEFNRCKSELKVIEGWALGCPVVASDVAPYRRAIDHGKNGFLCKSEEQWEVHLRSLIVNEAERFRIAGNGLKKLKEEYVMERAVYQMETAILKIAQRGNVPREECKAAIAKRMEDLEYEGNLLDMTQEQPS